MPRSPTSFVLCGATAPNGSFVNHQQLFGSVCKTAGLRIRSLFLAFLVVLFPYLGHFVLLRFPGHGRNFSSQKYLFFLAFLFPFLVLFLGPFWSLFYWPFFIPLRFLGHVLGRNLSGRKYLSVSPGKREFWGKSEMSV